MKTLTLDQWLQEAERRFGPKQLLWKFKCPACGHVQCAEDFRPYKFQGATSDSAHAVCIGRFGSIRREAFGAGEGPCNYTGSGLFDLRPVTVLMPDGKQVKSFDFADAPASASEPA